MKCLTFFRRIRAETGENNGLFSNLLIDEDRSILVVFIVKCGRDGVVSGDRCYAEGRVLWWGYADSGIVGTDG